MRWMPWRSQAKKDVRACEKPGGAGNEALIPGCPNGETHPFTERFRRAQPVKTPAAASGSRVWAGAARQNPSTTASGARARKRCVKGYPWLNP